jgi:initiation factor 1A
MPKNKGGSGFKKSKKPSIQFDEKLVFAQDTNEHYAKITKVYGSGRFGLHLISKNDDNVKLITSKEYMGILPGRMRKQKWKNLVCINDIVLVASRDFQTDDTKVDILHKYKPESTKKLEQMKLIPDFDNCEMGNIEITHSTENKIESWEEEFDDI